MMFLQALPTQSWGEKEIELLLSEACVNPWHILLPGSLLIYSTRVDSYGKACSAILVLI